jgi:hypothetical protein
MLEVLLPNNFRMDVNEVRKCEKRMVPRIRDGFCHRLFCNFQGALCSCLMEVGWD